MLTFLKTFEELLLWHARGARDPEGYVDILKRLGLESGYEDGWNLSHERARCQSGSSGPEQRIMPGSVFRGLLD
jgi:hypothetical protein